MEHGHPEIYILYILYIDALLINLLLLIIMIIVIVIKVAVECNNEIHDQNKTYLLSFFFFPLLKTARVLLCLSLCLCAGILPGKV